MHKNSSLNYEKMNKIRFYWQKFVILVSFASGERFLLQSLPQIDKIYLSVVYQYFQRFFSAFCCDFDGLFLKLLSNIQEHGAAGTRGRYLVSIN